MISQTGSSMVRETLSEAVAGTDIDRPAEATPVETAPETTLETVSGANPAPHRASPAISAPRLRQTLFRSRLPRFVRAKRSHRPPLALQDRDLDLLRTAHEYRLITTPQYLTRFSDESRDAIYRRLQKLFHHGYLNRIGSNPNAPLVYALGRRGAEVLEVFAQKDVGDRYVAHQLMIGDFRIAMTRAARERAIEFSWRPAPQDLPVRPDGFFSLRFPTLSDGRNTAHFFLEADRSTMTRERFVEKLRAYAAWQDAGGHTEAFGIRRFRVLTVTKSEERLASLVAAIAKRGTALPLSMFWFSSERRLVVDQTSALGAIWESPDAPAARKSLLPEHL